LQKNSDEHSLDPLINWADLLIALREAGRKANPLGISLLRFIQFGHQIDIIALLPAAAVPKRHPHNTYSP
jgi:hypothetical protein